MTADKSSLKTEAIAGITTFFTMAYIIVVNHQIISADVLDHAGNPVGFYLARWFVSDDWPAKRHSSSNVCAGCGADWIAGAGASEVFVEACGVVK